jgi:hypothetical protein
MIHPHMIKHVSPQQQLMKHMKFTAQDLFMNKSGRLSETQRQAIQWQEQHRWATPLIISAFLGLGLAALFAYIMLSMMIHETSEISTLPMIFSIGIAMLLIWSIMETITNFNEVEQKLHSKVVGIGGTPMIDDVRGYLKIGSMMFNLPYDTLIRISPTQPHIIYYLPRWNQVLSIEVVKR